MRQATVALRCEGVEPIANKVALLILQHPQEQDKTLGTARLAALHFKNATLARSVCRGPAWKRRSAAQAVHATASGNVLHLGSAEASSPLPRPEIAVLDKKGEALPNRTRAARHRGHRRVRRRVEPGQKTLWWRNAWVLKGKRIVIAPTKPSLYGKLRKEPRREGLSTLEAAALVLSKLERKPEIETTLLASFSRMLGQVQGIRTDRQRLPEPDNRGRRPFRRPKVAKPG